MKRINYGNIENVYVSVYVRSPW